MSSALSMILAGSLMCLAAGVAVLDSAGRRRRRLVLSALLVSVAVAVYRSSVQQDIEAKGPVHEAIAAACCYLSMLLGMAAQYCYRQAEGGADKLTFKPMEFMMPIFASPIVFIPLLTITTDVALSGAFTKSKLMVYLVAFQNGFFWKSFFEDRRQKAIAGATAC